MTIDPQLLNDIARRATKSSSRALSLLIGQEVAIKTTQATYLSLDKLVDLIRSREGSHVVAFSQLISGVKGAALLLMSPTDALHLVDSLMKRPMGTTKELGDIERSAIRETLNILSNSQLTALAQDLGVTINMLPPELISPEHIAHVLDYLAAHRGETTEIIVFETSMVVAAQESQVTMFIAFDAELAGIINSKEG